MSLCAPMRRAATKRVAEGVLAEMAEGDRDSAAHRRRSEVRTGQMGSVRMPHRHSHVLARCTRRAPRSRACDRRGAAGAGRVGAWTCRSARRCSCAPPTCWRRTWRDMLNAATMLGQSKTAHQAEIDAACELIDFLRFNVALRRADLARAAAQRRRGCGTGWTTGRWKASSSR